MGVAAHTSNAPLVDYGWPALFKVQGTGRATPECESIDWGITQLS